MNSGAKLDHQLHISTAKILNALSGRICCNYTLSFSRSETRIFRCWSVVTWLEGWKKSLLYAPMGAVPLICPHKLWLSYVAAGQLVALAFFHIVLSFKGRRRRKRKDRLLHGDIDSFERFGFQDS